MLWLAATSSLLAALNAYDNALMYVFQSAPQFHSYLFLGTWFHSQGGQLAACTIWSLGSKVQENTRAGLSVQQSYVGFFCDERRRFLVSWSIS